MDHDEKLRCLAAEFPYYFFSKSLTYFSYSSSVSFFTFFFMVHLAKGSTTIMDDVPQIYSVRSAMTGSFFAADCAGMSPEMSVSTMLMATIMRAVVNGSAAIPEIPARE